MGPNPSPNRSRTAQRRLCWLCLWCAVGGCSVYDNGLLRESPGRRSALDSGTRDAATMHAFDAGTPAHDDRSDTSALDAGNRERQDRTEPKPRLDAASDALPADTGPTETGPNDTGPADAGLSDSGPAACTAMTVHDYCAQIPRLPAPPVIDGHLDCALALQTVTPVAWNGAGSVPAAPTLQLAAAWRSNGLYVYVEVRGQAPSAHPAGTRIDCGDAIELYVDADGALASAYDLPGTMQFIIAAPRAAMPATIEAARYNGGANGVWTTPSLTTRMLEDGYALEAFITGVDLDLSAWGPTQGSTIGLDIALDVAGMPFRTSSGCTSGAQLGQYFLRVSSAADSCNHEPYCDPRAFCSPTLQP